MTHIIAKHENAMLKKRLVKQLKELQYHTGLFAASKMTVHTGYNKAWMRDNIYEALGLESAQDIGAVKKAYSALFDILIKHEWKIDHAIREKPQHKYQYIHARYHPTMFSEFHDEWGNKQNDAVGAFLFKVADLLDKGIIVTRSEHDLRMLQKLVHYLASIEYWHDKDNGMWEENEEVHASSVGACVAGLKAVSRYVYVPQKLIDNGMKTLKGLLPNESASKKVDLALLSLIYPYNIVTHEQKLAILHNVEHFLVRKRGVLRYLGDHYYNKDGKEAEWPMGFPWLAKIYKGLGNTAKYSHYIEKTLQAVNSKGELPELYFGSSEEHNENSPLGWANAMLLTAVA